MKRRIQLTEQDIVRMVKRAVNEVRLNEMDWRTYKNAEKESAKRSKKIDKEIDKKWYDFLMKYDDFENNEPYDVFSQENSDILNKYLKEKDRGNRFHDYSDELMNKKHDFDRENKYGTIHQYASSNPDTNSITLHKDFGNNSIEREFKASKNAKKPIEHRNFGNKTKYSNDNLPSYFSSKSDKHSDLFGDSSRLEKEIIGYNSGRDKYVPGKGWTEYGENNESLDRRVKKSIRESLNKMNEETFHVGSFPYGGGGVGESTYLQPGEKVKISAPRPGGGYGAHNMVGTILQYNGRTPEGDRPSYDVKLANGEILYAVHPRNIVKL